MRKDSWIREAAASSLGKMGADASAAVPRLVELLQDEAEVVRISAAVAIGQLGPGAKAAVPALIKAIQDPKNPDYYCADIALGSLGHDAPSPRFPILSRCCDIETTTRNFKKVQFASTPS